MKKLLAVLVTAALFLVPINAIAAVKAGDTCKIELEKSGSANKSKNAHVKMSWKTAVDLDLHAFAINSEDKFVHVSFAKKKSDCGNMVLDQDAGVGNSAGDNEENLVVHDLTKVKKLIFVANIFRFLVAYSLLEINLISMMVKLI